jgi:alcohol dehydrogenase (cytochrome c)
MLAGALIAGGVAHAQEAASTEGARSFDTRCAVCHGGDGNGSQRAPSLLAFVASHPDEEIAALIRSGVRAMPPHTLAAPEMTALLAYLHTLAPIAGAEAHPKRAVRLTSGAELEGSVLNESNFSLELAGDDGKIHRLERDGDSYREAPLAPTVDWPSYDGGFSGNRHSAMNQVNTSNVQRLALRWMFPVSGAQRLEATSVVVDGIMYVTAVNSVFALDAANGRQLWAYRRPQTPGILGEAAGGANRGVGVGADRVLMMTDNAHLLALDKTSGKLLWDVAMTDWPKSQYSASGAPLVIGNLVVTGVAGGEEGARGFLAAYDLKSGARQWQFWTIPAPGEKLAATWRGNALPHGCGTTWLTGSYDPALDLVYWAVGNPCPDYDGSERGGSNLYTDSVLALKPATGRLQWYFQFTPHDTHDWDAEEPLVLADATYRGRPRKLLLQANRNGFFFVLDRTNGEFLSATPYVSKVTWTTGFNQRGEPLLRPESEPTPEGNLVCPGSGTNWMSAAYDPSLQLFIFASLDRCATAKVTPGPFEMGKRFFNGTLSFADGSQSVRALDLQTGKTVWNFVQSGGGLPLGGTLSTDGGLVFFAQANGDFTALAARSGEPLWHFSANDRFRASPMTYMVGGRQYVCIAGAAGFFSFALPDDENQR